MENVLVDIGKHIKKIRKEKHKTIHDIAIKAKVTNGLISRIENGRTIPSLPVLIKIINALEIGVADFFKGIPLSKETNFILSRKEEHTIIDKEDDAVGFSYQYVFGKQITSLGFEVVLLHVEPNSQRRKISTDAYEFKFVVSGECFYIIGDEEVRLSVGDSIFFDGRIPHVPVNRGKDSCAMLVIYFFI
ncbi:MAG: XRE family transcriptional regulator [Flavobacteriaceae bacterium]